MIDCVVPLQLFPLEAGDLRPGVRYGGILGQVPVDYQFAAVRRGEELPLDELHTAVVGVPAVLGGFLLAVEGDGRSLTYGELSREVSAGPLRNS